MIAMDLVRGCNSTDRDQAIAVARDLRQAGINAVVLPSAWTIGVWEVELPADDLDLARAFLESASEH